MACLLWIISRNWRVSGYGQSFELKQVSLRLEPAPISAQAPVGANHPVAGTEEGESVGPARRTDRPGSVRIEGAGNLLVGAGLAVGDPGEQVAHSVPKRGRGGGSVVEGEDRTPALEVFGELAPSIRVFPMLGRAGCGEDVLPVLTVEGDGGDGGADDKEWADRGGDDVVQGHLHDGGGVGSIRGWR